MSILKIFLGKIGIDGGDGEDGSGVDDIRGSVMDNPLISGLYNNKLSRVGDVTVARDGEALYFDRYNEVAFSSSADVTNLTPYSNDFSMWDDPLNKWTILSTNNTDPFGGSTASEIQLDEDISEGESAFMEEVYSGLTNGTKFHTYSFWIKIISGTITGINANIGTNFNYLKADLTSSWQRVTASFSPNGNSFNLSLNIVGLSGAKFQIYGVQFEEGSVVNDYIATSGAPVTVSGTGTAVRQNELGNIITGEKTNFIPNSEDLNEVNWTITGGTVSEYTGLTPLNGYRKEIQLGFDAVQTLQLETTGTYTQGEIYVVSADLLVAGGTVTALTASVAGGAKVAFGEILTDGFIRMSVECIAGNTSGVIFEATSPTLNGQLILFGAQAEIESVGSYIRNGATVNTQPLDKYIANTGVQGSSSWTVSFVLNSMPVNSEIKYIFYGDSDFNCYIQDSDLKVKNGSTIKTIANMIDALNIVMTFDGATLKTYKNGVIESNDSITGASSTINSALYLGADSAGNNALNGQLSMFDFYNEKLTGLEVKYLVEEL